jgi:cytochrome P450
MRAGPIDYNEYSRFPTRRVRHIPGNSGAPIIGDSLRFLKDLPGLTRDKYLRYGPVFRVNAFFQDTIVLLGPDANEAILKDSNNCFSSALAWNTSLDKIFPNGLMLKDFEEHKYHRRILQLAFKRGAIERYVDAMSPQIAKGIATWQPGQPLRFYDHVKKLLLEVAAAVFLGLNVTPEAGRLNRSFVHAVEASLALVRISLPGNRWARGQRGRAYLEAFVQAHIAAKRDSDDQDIFAQVCRARDEEGRYFSEQAITDHLIFLLFAAHDTTTSTLCSIVFSLASNPAWQQRLREEYRSADAIHPGLGAISAMDDTALVFREALRMYPPLATIPRRCVRDTEVLGHRIPRNAGVGISPLFTHYMEEYWTAPTRFDPERFAPGRAEDKQHFFQYIPFGGGAHKCLGMHFAEVQSKLFLHHFLRHYEVSVEPGYAESRSVVPLSLPTDGLPVTLRKIEQI